MKDVIHVEDVQGITEKERSALKKIFKDGNLVGSSLINCTMYGVKLPDIVDGKVVKPGDNTINLSGVTVEGSLTIDGNDITIS